jgi:hypothetical protein
MISTVFTPWLSANAGNDPKSARTALSFDAEGSILPSYSVFRDVLSEQFLNARSRICVVSSALEDREIALMLFGASQRAVGTAVRVAPRVQNQSGRLQTVVDTLQFLGVPVTESSLKPLKLSGPTFIAIDRRVWAVNVPLSETSTSSVEVESAPWTSAEVCGWAGSAQSAKAATVR